MAGGKAGVLLLCTLAILSLVHLVLADWSSQVYEEYEWAGKSKPHGRKQSPKRKHGVGYYRGKAFYDSDDEISGGYEEGSDGADEQTAYYYRPSHGKPYHHKPKPTHYRPKPKYMFKPKPTKDAPAQSPPPQEEASAPPPLYNPPQEESPPQLEAPPMYSEPPAEVAPPPASLAPPPPYKRPYQPSYAPPTPSSSSWAEEWLAPHNAARAELGLPPMVWSDTVAQFAESWANQRKANGCGLQHSNGPYGENIFWGSGGSYGPAECVAAWVSEKQYYNYADNSCEPGQECGHYTQIVWATSLNLGCAKVQCDSGQIFMTCNYDPPGNWIGSKPY